MAKAVTNFYMQEKVSYLQSIGQYLQIDLK